MSQRKIFESLGDQKIHYTPQLTGRKRAPSIITIDEKDYSVESDNIGAGKHGAVSVITGTNLLRKKGYLDKTNYTNIQREIFFHEKYYGSGSIVAKYFSDAKKEEVPAKEIKQRVAEEEALTYCLIRKNITGDRLYKKLEQYKSHRKRTLLLYLRTAEKLLDLHNHGIIHGDPHFNNFIVDEEDNVFVIDFGCSYTLSESATMISDEGKEAKGKAFAPERRRSLYPKNNASADVTQDTYTYGFCVASTLQKTNLLSEPNDANIHVLLSLMQSSELHRRPPLEKIIGILASAYNKTQPQTTYVPELKSEQLSTDKPTVTTCKSRIKTYAPPLICTTLSSMGLFASTHLTISGLGKVYGIVTTLCAHIPVGGWVLLLCLSVIWLGRNIYVNCISSPNSETQRPAFQFT